MSKDKVLKDLTIKILSVIFAILLWLYVITEQNPVVPKDITVPVKIVNLESLNKNNLVMLEDPNSYSITLKLKGKKEILDAVSRNSFNVSADVGSYSVLGENSVPVEINGLPDGVTITSNTDYSIKVTLDKKLVVQKPVLVNVTGNPMGGLAILDPVLSPSAVVLTGAQSVIDKVRTVRVDVDIAGVSANVTEELPIRLLDENGKDVKGVELDTQWINVTVPVANTKRVPIELVLAGTPAEGFMLTDKTAEPKEILLTGDQQILEDLTSVNTNIVKIDNLNASTTLPVTLDLPEGIRLVNANEKINAALDIQQIVTRAVDISNIELRNLGTGYKADDFPARNIRLTVRGPESLVNNIEEGISLYIDLSEAKEGKGSYQVKWNKAPLLEVLEAVPQSIELDIRKVE